MTLFTTFTWADIAWQILKFWYKQFCESAGFIFTVIFIVVEIIIFVIVS